MKINELIEIILRFKFQLLISKNIFIFKQKIKNDLTTIDFIFATKFIAKLIINYNINSKINFDFNYEIIVIKI